MHRPHRCHHCHAAHERIRHQDYAARGFAAGLAAHGLGTARAFTADEVAGTFAGIAMGLNDVLTAMIVPFALHWFVR
jgi:putative effector of murein hydrolase